MFKTSERPAANKIREIRAIRVRIKQSMIRVQKLFVKFGLFVFKPPVSAPAANKIREIRAIRVRIKHSKIRVQKNIRSIRLIRVQKNLVFKKISCNRSV